MNSPMTGAYMLRVTLAYTAALIASLAFGLATKTNYDAVWAVIMIICAGIGIANFRRDTIGKALFEVGITLIFAVVGYLGFRAVGL